MDFLGINIVILYVLEFMQILEHLNFHFIPFHFDTMMAWTFEIHRTSTQNIYDDYKTIYPIV